MNKNTMPKKKSNKTKLSLQLKIKKKKKAYLFLKQHHYLNTFFQNFVKTDPKNTEWQTFSTLKT